MARPRTPIGTHGRIAGDRLRSGRYSARTRYRDWDGKARTVQCTADSRAAAERLLKHKLSERPLFQPTFTGMNADTGFGALVDYWIEDMDIEDRLSKTTRVLYERNMRTLVLPFFQNLSLREIGVSRCDYFIKQLAKQSYNRARQARNVMRLALGLAVRHELIPRNPMDHVSRLRRPPKEVNSFTPEEIRAVRGAIRTWENRKVVAGPRPDKQLGQILEVILGTSARIGELLAIRLCDFDLKSSVPSVRICGTIISRPREETHRQDHPRPRSPSAESHCHRSLSQRSEPAFACSPCAGGRPCSSPPGTAPRTQRTTSGAACATSRQRPASPMSPRTGSKGLSPRRSTRPRASSSPPSCSGTRTRASRRGTTCPTTKSSTSRPPTIFRRPSAPPDRRPKWLEPIEPPRDPLALTGRSDRNR